MAPHWAWSVGGLGEKLLLLDRGMDLMKARDSATQTLTALPPVCKDRQVKRNQIARSVYTGLK